MPPSKSNDSAPYNAAMAAHHLAQLNVATLRAPLDTPEPADLVAQLEPANALADGSPGFIRRLQTEDGDATAIRAFDDDRIIAMGAWGARRLELEPQHIDAA